jgi:hypothetical protein
MGDFESEISRQEKGPFSLRDRQITRVSNERLVARERWKERTKEYSAWIGGVVGAAIAVLAFGDKLWEKIAWIMGKIGGH